MLVQRVVMPGGGAESWTVLVDAGEMVEPVERYLAYLAAIERSPNTVRAYAVSLKLSFEFLAAAIAGEQGLHPESDRSARRPHRRHRRPLTRSGGQAGHDGVPQGLRLPRTCPGHLRPDRWRAKRSES